MRILNIRPRPRLTLLAALIVGALLLVPGLAYAQEASLGIASFNVTTGSTQAGGHGDLTVGFSVLTDESGETIGQARDVKVALPPGIVGNPLSTPRCTSGEFEAFGCKPPAQIGIMLLGFHLPGQPNPPPAPIPLYNLIPLYGHLATFAGSFLFSKFLVQVDLAKDGTGGLRVTVEDLPTLIPLVSTSLTIWGVPASPTHNLERSRTEALGPQPIYTENEFGELEVIGIDPTVAGVPPTPFLTNPTNCSSAPLQSTIEMDSWQKPGEFVSTTPASIPTPTECDRLHIAPTIDVQPDVKQIDSSAGYEINLHYPLDEAPYNLGTPALRKAEFTLPLGTSLSPAVATGLVGCTDAQLDGEACPEASKVGTVAIATPLLSEPLRGSIYIGTSTPTAMYRIFISAAGHGIVFHLKGVANPDPSTGQLSIVFEEMPQLPFEELSLHLFGGPGAAFDNSATCGQAGTTSQITSYSGQISSPSSSFAVDSNVGGGPCPSNLPFGPSFSAGTTSPLAASYSPLNLTISRPDGQQNLSTIAVKLPPGLLALLSSVPQCPEPQASAGTCPATSETGTATIGAGAGSHPLWLPGHVYLTGPYKGAPFGLSIVVPAIAGPFDLGTIVIRAQITVDPHDLHLTIVSDPLPQIRDGILLRVKGVNLAINRPGFIFNPTSCSPGKVIGTFGSSLGQSSSLSTPFNVAGCKGLPFKPRLAFTTQFSKRSSGDSASLNLLVSSTHGQTNLRSIVVRLPKQLQSRLTTLQGACLSTTYDADRRKCPAASMVGEAKINTPILHSPLSGPVYLVSHGRSSSPTLSMVLQGEGITVDLNGAISILKKGITRSAFNGLPDAPITSFSFKLFQGPHSLLGPNGDMCSKALLMPTTVTAQNGSQAKLSAKVAVSGCHTKKKA